MAQLRAISSLSLIFAGITFWLTWYLMPDVGTTDAKHILTIAAKNRESIFASSVVQLLSSAALAPAILYIVQLPLVRGRLLPFFACSLFLVGAMGMAADAVYHQMAYEMAHPEASIEAMVPVMTRMQTEDIRTLVPLIGCFFFGNGLLALSLGWLGVTSWWPLLLNLAALLFLPIGIVLVLLAGASSHLVGLCFLAFVAGSMVFMGSDLFRGI